MAIEDGGATNFKLGRLFKPQIVSNMADILTEVMYLFST